MSNLSPQYVGTGIPSLNGYGWPTPRGTEVTLFWVGKKHLASRACGSTERASQERIGVRLPVPVPLRTTVWVVFPDGGGFWAVAESCQSLAAGYLAELRLVAR